MAIKLRAPNLNQMPTAASLDGYLGVNSGHFPILGCHVKSLDLVIWTELLTFTH
jgi:hypothetical protein